jgi:hypothetical protein
MAARCVALDRPPSLARAMSDRDTFRAGFEYLPSLPASLPDHRVLVHNKGAGFRAWLQENDETLEVCACAFASELGRHYVPMGGAGSGGKTPRAQASGALIRAERAPIGSALGRFRQREGDTAR